MSLHPSSLTPPSSSSYLRSFSYPSPSSSQDESPPVSFSSSSVPLPSSFSLRNRLSSSPSSSLSSFSSLPLHPRLSTAYHRAKNNSCRDRVQGETSQSTSCFREFRQTRLVMEKRKEDQRRQGMASIDSFSQSIDREARDLYQAKLVKRTCCISSPSSSPHHSNRCSPSSLFFCLRRSLSCPPPLSPCSPPSPSPPVSGGLLSRQKKSSIQQSPSSCSSVHSSSYISSTSPVSRMKRKKCGGGMYFSSLSAASQDQQGDSPDKVSCSNRDVPSSSLRLLIKNPENCFLQSFSSSSSSLSQPCPSSFSSCVDEVLLPSSANQSDSVALSSPDVTLHTQREGDGKPVGVEEEEQADSTYEVMDCHEDRNTSQGEKEEDKRPKINKEGHSWRGDTCSSSSPPPPRCRRAFCSPSFPTSSSRCCSPQIKRGNDIAESPSTSFRRGNGEEEKNSFFSEFGEGNIFPSYAFCSSCRRHRRMTKPISHICIRQERRRRRRRSSRCALLPNEKKRGVNQEEEEEEKSLIVGELLQSKRTKNDLIRERKPLALSGNTPTEREKEKKSSTIDIDRNRHEECQRSLHMTLLRRINEKKSDEKKSFSSLPFSEDPSYQAGKSEGHLPSSSSSSTVSRSAFSSLSFAQYSSHVVALSIPPQSSPSCFIHSSGALSVFPRVRACLSSSSSPRLVSSALLPAAVTSTDQYKKEEEEAVDTSSYSSPSSSIFSPGAGENKEDEEKEGEGKRDGGVPVEERRKRFQDNIILGKRRRRDEKQRLEVGECRGDEEGGKKRGEVCLLFLQQEEYEREGQETCVRDNEQQSQGEKDDKKDRREKIGEKEEEGEHKGERMEALKERKEKEEEGKRHDKVTPCNVSDNLHRRDSPANSPQGKCKIVPLLLGILEKNERQQTSFPRVFYQSSQERRKTLCDRMPKEKPRQFDFPIQRPLPSAFNLSVQEHKTSPLNTFKDTTNRCYEETFPSLLETPQQPRFYLHDPRHAGLFSSPTQLKLHPEKKSFSLDPKATVSPSFSGRRKSIYVVRKRLGFSHGVNTEKDSRSREEGFPKPPVLLMRSSGGSRKGEIERGGQKEWREFSKDRNRRGVVEGEERRGEEEREREGERLRLVNDGLMRVKKRREMARRSSRDISCERRRRRAKDKSGGLRVHTEKENDMKSSSSRCCHEKAIEGEKESHVSSGVALQWRRLNREEKADLSAPPSLSSSSLPAIHCRSSSSTHHGTNVSDDTSTRTSKRESNSKKTKKKTCTPCPKPPSSSSLYNVNRRVTTFPSGFFASKNEELGWSLSRYRDRYLNTWKEAPQTTAPHSSYWSVGLPVPCSLLPKGWVQESLRGRDSRTCHEEDKEEEEEKKMKSVTTSCCNPSKRRDGEKTETTTAEDEFVMNGKGRVKGKRRQGNVKAEGEKKDAGQLGSQQRREQWSAAGVLMVQALYNLEKEQLLLPSYHVYDKNGKFQGMLPYAAFIQYSLPKEDAKKRGENVERAKKSRGKADETHGVVKNAGVQSPHFGRGSLSSGVCTASSGVCTAHSGVRARHTVCSFHPESMAHQPSFNQTSGVEVAREDVNSLHPGGEEHTTGMVETGRKETEKTVKKRQGLIEAPNKSHQVPRLQGDIVANSKLSGCELFRASACEKKKKRKTQVGCPGLATPLPVMNPAELTSLHEVVAKLYGSGASRTDVIKTWPAHPTVLPHRTSPPCSSGKVEENSHLGGVPAEEEEERRERNEIKRKQTMKSSPLGRPEGGGEEETKRFSRSKGDTPTGEETSSRRMEGQFLEQETAEKSVEEDSTSVKGNDEDPGKENLTGGLCGPVPPSLRNCSLGAQKEREKEGCQTSEKNKKVNPRRPEGGKPLRRESEDCGLDVGRSKETDADGHENKKLVEKRCSEEKEDEEDMQRHSHQEHVEEIMETQDAQEKHAKGDSTALPPVQKAHAKRSQIKTFKGVFAALCYMAKALLEESNS
ncbi:hypothetical protein CSUI_008210 [Cystoisospora suis]|uniref:Uncharacterized protein n=1 Tax=Cystoisospora suis TaxID=483139 RepID=A0A2C6KNK6_9APIC|nr:hypothetical protein CSUI_008210 [Cystoisospora suis]